jgi:hypothetical protein
MRPVTRGLPLLLLAACAHAQAPATDPPPAPPPAAVPAPPPDPIPGIRADVEELLAAQAEAAWRSWTKGAPLAATAAQRGRERLSDGSALAAVESALARAGGEEAHALRQLRAFLLGEALAAATSVEAAGSAAASAATFAWGGRSIALRDSAAALAAEADPARRAALDAARAPAAARAAAAADAEAAALDAASRRLGQAGLPGAAAVLRGRSPDALAALAEATLAATRSPYCSAMEALSRRFLGAPLASTGTRDQPRLARVAHEPRAFPAGRLVADGDSVASGLGMDVVALVEIDDQPRPGKSQRPLAVAVEIPGRVRLSVLPLGGAAESRAFLHEMGVALYQAHIRATGLEDRRLGPPAVPETWGYLLEGLTADPAWLQERAQLGGHALAREVRVAHAERLHRTRLLAARVLREVDRWRGGDPGPAGDAAVLGRALCRAVGVEEAARWPIARDPLLRSAEALQASLLAAQLESFLAGRARGPWWRSPENGAWLAATWSRGSRIGPEELARSAGFAGVEPGPLGQARPRIDGTGW